MKVFIEKTDQHKTLKFEGTVAKLLEVLKINPETVLVTKKEEVITEDEIVSNNDEIKLLSIISGG